MPKFRNISIGTKLTVLLIGLVSLVLLLSTVAALLNHYQSSRTSMIAQLSALADVLGDNSSVALQFDDQLVAEEVLSSLRHEPTVVFARTFDSQDKPFATYKLTPGELADGPDKPEVALDQTSVSLSDPDAASDELDQIPTPESGEHEFQPFFRDGHLHVVRKILRDDETVGTIYLRASMELLYGQLRHEITIATVVLLGCLTLAIVLAWGVQGIITRPILRLVKATELVSVEGDYSTRVEKSSDDEVGVLCEGFNSMLARIEQKETEVGQSNAKLELTVKEVRTTLAQLQERDEELESTNRELDHTIRGVRDAVGQLTDMSDELMGSIARQAAGAHQQAAAVHKFSLFCRMDA